MTIKQILYSLSVVVFLTSFASQLGAMNGQDSASLDNKIDRLESSKLILEEKRRKLTEKDGVAETDQRVTRLDRRITKIDETLVKLAQIDGDHNWIVKLLAGKDNAELVKGATPESIGGAIGYGFLAQGLGAIGGFMTSKMRKSLDMLLGGVWDSLLRKIMKPFDTEQFNRDRITMWRFKFVDKLKVINTILNQGTRDSLRQLDQVSRQYEDGAAQNGEAAQPQVDEVWMTFVRDSVTDYKAFMAQVNEAREEDYEEGDPIITYLDTIGQLLFLVFSPLSKSTSPKDFDSKLGQTKSCILTVMDSVDRYFKQIWDIVNNRRQTLDNLTSTQNTPAQQSNFRSGPMDQPSSFSSQM